MTKLKLYKLAKKLGINRKELNDILERTIVKSKISYTTSDLYKNGTHYGTISIRNFLWFIRLMIGLVFQVIYIPS